VTALPDRQFFKIGEAAEIVGVKAHVLRYWESEFPSIRPLKTRGAHRMYRRADVELLCVIHKLLHHEGYTIAGARKRVRELRAELKRGDATRPALASSSQAAGAPLGEPAAMQGAGSAGADAPVREAGAFLEGSGEPSALREVSHELGLVRDASREPGPLRAASREVALLREASRELGLRAELIQVRRELSDLLRALDQGVTLRPAAAHASATVTAVVAKTVLIPQRKQLR
jgi:DNA-binding transcriptional MerR regulator